jgi:predicted outer membrane repeat protein
VECHNCSISNNFAVTAAIASTTSGGYFEFYDSQIYNNYAIANPIALITEGVVSSKMNSWDVHSNVAVSKSDVLSHYQNRTMQQLSFVPSSVLQHQIETGTINSTNEAKALIAQIEFSNFTLIHNEEVLISAFISSVSFTDCKVYDIYLVKPAIEVTSSTLKFERNEIKNIRNPSNHRFVLVLLESMLVFEMWSMEDSNSNLFVIRNSEVSINGLAFRNTTSQDSLFDIESSVNVFIKNLTAVNSSTSVKTLYKIRNTGVKLMSEIMVSDAKETVINLENSLVEQFSNSSIFNCSQALTLSSSIIKEMKNVTFSYNGDSKVHYGGAMMLLNSDLTIIDSLFSNNIAQIGGGISHRCRSLTLWHLKLGTTKFESNNATIKGGAIYYDYKRPEFENVTYVNNSADYGPNIASYPVKILLNDSNSEHMVLNNIGSKIQLETPLNLKLVDYDGQTMNQNNFNQILIQATDEKISSISGFNSELLREGVVTFHAIQFVGSPGSKNVKYQASSKAIDKSKIDQVFGSQLSDNQISVNFRFCRSGEIDEANQFWIGCSPGTYSFVWNSTEWRDWLDNAICLGKTVIYVEDGYWRRTTNSTDIIECPNQDACLGGYYDNEDQPTKWKTGYEGNLWSECSVTKDGKYQRQNENEWAKCPNPAFNAIRVIGLILLVFLFIMVIIVTNIRKTKESQMSTLLRILTNYLQLLTLSMSFDVSYPDSLSDMFIPVSRIGASSSTFLSFDWFVEDYEIKGPFPSNSFFKIFLSALLPLILVLIVSLIWVALYFIKRKWIKDIRRNIVISIISILFFLHPKLTESSLSIFRWIDVGDRIQKVKIDTTMQCYSYEHIKWTVFLGIPTLIV